MNKGKRLLSLILSLLMLLSMIPAAAYADEIELGEIGADIFKEAEETEEVVEKSIENEMMVLDTTDEIAAEVDEEAQTVNAAGSCGLELYWEISSSGVLTIYGYGDMENYSSGKAPWYDNRSNIKRVVIEDGVTSIGEYAFYYCSEMTAITLPDSLLSIGKRAFYDCDDLTALIIPDSVEMIGENMARDCDSLVKVVVGNGLLDIPKQAFYDCDKLATLTIGENVATIDTEAFYSCGQLTNLTLGSSVNTIGIRAFEHCAKLPKLTIPKSVSRIEEYAFYGCESLEKLTIGANVTYIGPYAFAYAGMTSLTIPKSVKEIGERAFYECDNMKTLTIGAGVTYIPAYCFYYCDQLTSVTFGSKVETIGKYAFGYCKALTSVNLTNSVRTLEDCAFYYCTAMTSVSIPDGVSEIGEDAFYRCEKLISVDLPDSLQILNDGVFGYCYSLSTIVMHEGLTYIGEEVFRYCESLGAIVIPESVFGITEDAFYCCTGLKKICFKGDAPSIVDDAFYKVTATCYYPKGNDTWDSTTKVDYSGDLVWKSYNVANPPYECDAPKISASNVASTGKIKLTWKTISGADCYQVFRSTEKNGSYKLMKTVNSATWTDTGATANKVYYYYVVAISEFGDKSGRSNIVNRRCDLKRPTVTLTNVADTGKVKVSWKAITGAVKYKVYRSTSKNGEYVLQKTVTGTSLINNSAKAGKTYYYKVVAVAENTAANSAYSEVKSRMCDLARPEVSITRSNGDPKLNWNKVTNAAKYYVYRSTSKDGSYSKIATVTSRSFVDTSAKAGKTYFYKVVAVHSNSNANSAKSTAVSIKAK